MKAYILTLLSNRPEIGILASFGGTTSSVLAACKLISVVFGALGAILGCAVGIVTLIIKLREWRQGRKPR